MKRLARVLLAIPLLFLALLATLAVYWSNLPWAPLRSVAAAVLAVGAVWLIWKRKYLVFSALWVGIALWWYFIPPSNDRDWKTDVARVATVTFDGDRVAIGNIRNFDYRSETDYTVRYYHKTYDLSKVRTADLFVVYWDAGPAVAHTMVSFGFEGDEYLCLSVEIRGEKGEAYGGLAGLFRQYEIIYVVADERDLVKLRTNHRGEHVYLFRTELKPAEVRLLLEDILRELDKLSREPAWYRTIGRNCTTSLVNHMNSVWPNRTPWTKKVIMNGYAAEQAYERGMIKSDLPYEEFKKKSYINPVAQAHGDKPGFSRAIRAHLR